jgi:hypothetical protein
MLERESCYSSGGKVRERLAFPPINRRKFIRLGAALGAGALAADGIFLEPNSPRMVRLDLRLRRWPSRLDGFTIALLSDFHYDPYFSIHPLKTAIGMVNGLRPNLIALTGDFVSIPWFGPSTKGAAMAEPCAEWLRQLQAPQGIWAVLGNHDALTNPARVTSALHAAGIQVLANQAVPIERNGSRFWLGGVKDVLVAGADIGATLRPVPSQEAVVLMAHEPDFADDVARHPVDLQLSGHSHGGQVRVPLVGPLYLPELARKYVSGLYQIGQLSLYTTRGIGTIEVPVRFNCPPEITLLTVRCGSGA